MSQGFAHPQQKRVEKLKHNEINVLLFLVVCAGGGERDEFAAISQARQLCIVLAHYAHFWWISETEDYRNWLPRLDLNQ